MHVAFPLLLRIPEEVPSDQRKHSGLSQQAYLDTSGVSKTLFSHRCIML